MESYVVCPDALEGAFQCLRSSTERLINTLEEHRLKEVGIYGMEGLMTSGTSMWGPV